MRSPPHDAVDRAILFQLQSDARRPITAIAESLNVSDNTVRNRMRSLEEAGVITGYRATINFDSVAVQHYYAFSCTARVRDRESLASAANQLPGVVEVITLMTGRENILVVAAAFGKDDITDLAANLDEIGLEIVREHLISDHRYQPFDGFKLENNI